LQTNQLRHNLLLRLSHTQDERTFALEYVLTPEDHGSVLTLLLEDNSLERQKLRVGARLFGGADDTAYGAVADTWIIFATWEMGWRL
jgi:hypothetical protein